MRRGLVALCVTLGAMSSAHAQPSAAAIAGKATHARATLQPVAGVSGRTSLLLMLRVDDGWHVSYRNPGETGLPTRLQWSLPADVQVANEIWPVPTVTRTDVGVTHTLQGDVPWLIEFDAPRTADDRLVSVTVRYGVCREVCIPAQLTVQGVLPGATGAAPPPLAAAVRSQLIRDGGALVVRRASATRVCFATAPLGSVSALPDVLADTTMLLPVTLGASAPRATDIHKLFMNASDSSTLRAGRRFLFVRGGAGVSVRLEFGRPAPECRGAR